MSTNRYTLTREMIVKSWLPAETVVYTEPGVEVHLFNSLRTNLPAAAGFVGKQAKPILYGAYRTEEQRDQAVAQFVSDHREQQAWKAERRAKRNAPHTLKVGDILNTSWGYDQTNVEFYQVIAVPTPHTVIVREVAQHREGTGWLCGNCAPVHDKFIGPPLTKRPDGSDNSIHISDVQTAWVWDGTPHYYSQYA